jgi:hypothetical protein
LLVSWCAGRRCGMTCSDEDRGRSRRSGAEDQGWSYRSSGTVCGLHRAREGEERGFFDSASKPLGRFVSGLVSKPLGQFVSDLTSKSLGRFFLV